MSNGIVETWEWLNRRDRFAVSKRGRDKLGQLLPRLPSLIVHALGRSCANAAGLQDGVCFEAQQIERGSMMRGLLFAHCDVSDFRGGDTYD